MGRKNNQLRVLANLAKQRMLNRNYEEYSTKNTYTPKVSNYFLRNAQAIRKLNAEREFISISNKFENEFIKRVCSLLEEDGLIFNPLGILADKKYLNSLNEIEKQSYMLNLAEKYNAIKELYESNRLEELNIV